MFEELWNTINENYLYRDFNGLDWDAIYTEYRQEVESGLTDQEFYNTMDEMIDRLNDDHSDFFSPDEVAQMDDESSGSYNYVGIGVLTAAMVERNRISIVLVFPNSPATDVGLKIHDSILAVNGQPVIDESGSRHDLLFGPEGSRITLTVQSPGNSPRQVEIIRRQIDSELPVPHESLKSKTGKKIGYILLATFQDNKVDDKIAQALQELNTDTALEGLIIDNRQNSGGSSDVLIDTLSMFTGGLMGYYVGKQNERPLTVQGKDINGSQDLPLVVLVGESTVSFGEIFAGILMDLERAHIMGDTTKGNVEVLHVYNFQDGSRAWIAQETFRPLKNPLQNWEVTGIIPAEQLSANWDEYTLETDPVVAAALNYFDTR